ncbi:hypothetical protein [Nonomuraea sp. NPDC050310]|uniref:hypothetical protein n=1 Tax=Nonomuraea sp. NPDC050310 TaxID=3154935 RepID=UPI0033DB92E8
MDDFPADQTRAIRAVQAAASTAQSSVQRRQPLKEASQGWILRSSPGPNLSELGPGDVWIGAESGRLVAIDSSGTMIPLVEIPPFPQADSVEVGVVSIPSAPATYDQNHSATLRLMIFTLNNALTALIAELKESGQMRSF